MESKAFVLVAALLLLAACYGEPRLPDPMEPGSETATQREDAAPSPEPIRQGEPASPDPGAQAHRMEELTRLLDRLGRQGDETPTEARDGAATWRPSELEKLAELCEACCKAGSAPCRDCLGTVAERDLPADELWPLMGRFLGELRPRAGDGTATLGASLLLRDNGVTRDRAFRVATGSGAARRGQPDAEDRRGSTVPISPEEGERVLFVVEQPSSCPNAAVDLKGPTAAGRWDLDFAPDCPEPAEQPDDITVLRATRAVWAFDAGPLPATGFQLWTGGEAPLVEVSPPAAGPLAKP